MAAPITHIVLANKVYKKYFSDKDPRKFFVGTSFPDIRYLANIGRESTHFHGELLKDIQVEEAFASGLKFHALLDEVREKFVASKDIYSLMPESKFIPQAIKYLEDEMLYDRISDWSVFVEYFNDVLEEETLFEVSNEEILKWHEILKSTFAEKPSPASVVRYTKQMQRPITMATEINRLVQIIRKEPRILAIIEELYQKFDDLLK